MAEQIHDFEICNLDKFCAKDHYHFYSLSTIIGRESLYFLLIWKERLRCFRLKYQYDPDNFRIEEEISFDYLLEKTKPGAYPKLTRHTADRFACLFSNPQILD